MSGNMQAELGPCAVAMRLFHPSLSPHWPLVLPLTPRLAEKPANSVPNEWAVEKTSNVHNCTAELALACTKALQEVRLCPDLDNDNAMEEKLLSFLSLASHVTFKIVLLAIVGGGVCRCLGRK